VKSLIVAKRFCGPPTSANGGYFAGMVASLAPQMLSVRLAAPPPLETELSVTEVAGGGVEIRHGDELMGTGTPATLDLQVPSPIVYSEAIEASRSYRGFVNHPFPTCFVCGVNRSHGDGLCIYPGAVPGRDIVAAPWMPDASLGRGDGNVREEFVWAALDCPGYYGVTSDGRPMLLAQFTAQLDRKVKVGEPCTVIGWGISSSGRKHEAGTALFNADGELCGRARAIWVEPRPPG
jgi:hypothetical protein